MKWAGVAGFVVTIWMLTAGSVSAQSNLQFSATAVQSTPDGRSREAKMYVGDNQVRMEHRRGDLTMVEIYDMKNQRVLLLVPNQSIYMQREVPGNSGANPMLPPKDSNPCKAIPDSKCTKLGSETLYNRPVSKWEVSVERDGEQMRSLHWIDDERFMSLRDVWPDGVVSEQTLAGSETLNGRSVERWVKTTTLKEGKKEITTQWYDPQLQIAIREQLPGGLFRELKDIDVAPQPQTLFDVPEGYRQVENAMPEPQGQRQQ